MKVFRNIKLIAIFFVCVNTMALDVGCVQSRQNVADMLDQTCRQEIAVEKGYKFDLLGCERTGGTVVCHLSITSQGEDRELRILARTRSGGMRVIDDDGASYKADRIKSGRHDDERMLERMFFANSPAEVSISFGKIPEEVIQIKYLDLLFQDKRTNKLIKFQRANLSFCDRR